MTAEADRSARRRSLGRRLLRAAVLAAAFVALVAFSVVLAKVTLTPSPASEDIVTSNLRPGRSLRQYAEDYTFLAACKQAGGNLLLGAPFGVLLPILVPRRLRMIRMTVLTVLVIAVVELVQGALVAGRAFDVDDVILNTAGALLGYVLLGRRLSHHYHALADERPAAEAAKNAPRHPAGTEPGDKARPGWWSKSGTAAKPVTKAKAGTGTKAGAKAKAAAGTKTAGTSKTGSKAKPAAEPVARRSASARMARGRALFDRWRGRREGPGGGAPGARRRGA
ncbi:VanZ family protein [Streptomyces sp. SID7815]|uniref:VanZ family protein n=1 Tax=Streptomyces pratensis (strain ATCC 33331 / IAF-45CD) TaxID=591167 RepID=A0A8D3WPH1_STRFA|nr:VanZ family protein [Streptomyces sp. SID7815]